MSNQPMSEYQKLWTTLRDAPVGKEVRVTVSIANRETLIQALHRTKCAENRARIALGLPTFGKTIVKRYVRTDRRDTKCIVGFTLTFSLEQLV